MTLQIYLFNKLLKAIIICSGVSFSFFFIFSLIGNLGEKFSFNSILFLSALNSFQIFTYIPSHLFILSLSLFAFNLKSKNELIIIKEYFELKNLLLIIFPILTLFIFIETKKDDLSINIEKIKSNLISSKNFDSTKILISINGNNKKYNIYSGYDRGKAIIKEYLNFEIQNNKIYKGEISTNLNLLDNDLYTNISTIYENNEFRHDDTRKKIFENFINFWSNNTGGVIKDKIYNLSTGYNYIHSILFYILFYLSVFMIFLSKKIVDRNINTTRSILLFLSFYLYYLLVPKIFLNNFQYIFQILSIIIFTLIFFKIKKYE